MGVGWCATGRDWTSVFSGRVGDNSVSSGMVSNTCENEGIFFSDTRHKSPLATCRMISTGDVAIILARLISKGHITVVALVNKPLPLL